MTTNRRLAASRGIARRLQVVVGTAAGLVLGLTVWLNYRASRAELERQTNSKAGAEIRAAASRLDDFIARLGMLPRDIAIRQQAYGHDPDPGIVPHMRELLRQTPAQEVYGVYIAYEEMDWRDPNSIPGFDRKSWPDNAPVKYDFHDPEQEWYNGPKQSGRFHVSEPYFDEGGSDITMVSLTVPVFDAASNFVGVAGVDLSLERIRELVGSIRLLATIEAGRGPTAGEFAFLVSRAGKIVAHPDEQLMLRQGFDGADLTDLPEGIFVAAAAEGFAAIGGDGDRRRFYWADSPLAGWKVVLSVPERAILGPVRELTLRSAAIGVAGLLAMVTVVSIIARRLAHPLLDLTRTASAVERGEFREEMLGDLTRRRDEIGELGRSFRNMARQIQAREQRLAEMNQNLERAVSERTAELTARAGELEELSRQSQERAALESSLSALNTSLRGNLAVAEVAERGLAASVQFVGAAMGALFVAGTDGAFHREAAHAYPITGGPPKSFGAGIGIVGQVAQSRRPIHHVPDGENLRLFFGFGAIAPSHVAVYPLVANEAAVGVLELCLFKPPTEVQVRWLEKASETLATALRFALDNEGRRGRSAT